MQDFCHVYDPHFNILRILRILPFPLASKTLTRSLLSPPPTTDCVSISPLSISRCLLSLHSFVSDRFNFHNHGRILPSNSRAIATRSVLMQDAATEAVSAALAVDNRVPATVITGFLGSGKEDCIIQALYGKVVYTYGRREGLVYEKNEVVFNNV
ncbi:uncharacterized protein LOC131227181 [Magnolia sinica]|uniref:uncharacterized protein LOC131227181 n=1 Tax=Magnolia sinica TaxID=86752 RepID=UPI00265A858E|nr:uncharacterized protein LOC131227181 [Magnolia sinica]